MEVKLMTRCGCSRKIIAPCPFNKDGELLDKPLLMQEREFRFQGDWDDDCPVLMEVGYA